MRLLWLLAGSIGLGGCVARALRHVVMVPIDDPALWIAAVGGSVFALGLAVMPGDKP